MVGLLPLPLVEEEEVMPAAPGPAAGCGAVQVSLVAAAVVVGSIACMPSGHSPLALEQWHCVSLRQGHEAADGIVAVVLCWLAGLLACWLAGLLATRSAPTEASVVIVEWLGKLQCMPRERLQVQVLAVQLHR